MSGGRQELLVALDRRTWEFNAQAVMFSQAVAGRLGINADDGHWRRYAVLQRRIAGPGLLKRSRTFGKGAVHGAQNSDQGLPCPAREDGCRQEPYSSPDP